MKVQQLTGTAPNKNYVYKDKRAVTNSSCYHSTSIPLLPCFLHKNLEINKCKTVVVPFAECGCNN